MLQLRVRRMKGRGHMARLPGAGSRGKRCALLVPRLELEVPVRVRVRLLGLGLACQGIRGDKLVIFAERHRTVKY